MKYTSDSMNQHMNLTPVFTLEKFEHKTAHNPWGKFRLKSLPF